MPRLAALRIKGGGGPNHTNHDALNMGGIGLLHQNRSEGVVRRVQLNRSRFPLAGPDRVLSALRYGFSIGCHDTGHRNLIRALL